ncbi:MAG: hypothetical protein LBV77_06035 [Candidatus Adiutrix intracellularis]|nr:hypothetical protein [Candidatus Adiutrix intracellularis]
MVLLKARAICNSGEAYIAVTLGGKLMNPPRTMQEEQLVNAIKEIGVVT